MASNISTSSEARAGGSIRGAIEGYPHLVGKLCALWGSAEFDTFANRLLTDSRDGKRQGFPPEVAAELLLLVETNRIVRAIDLARAQKIPLKEAYRLIEQGDEARAKASLLDNPQVSPDARRRNLEDAGSPRIAGRKVATAPRPREAAKNNASFSPISFLFSKTFWLIVLVLLTVKLVWPYLA